MHIKPKISIIVPSFNQGNYLEECLDSIIRQNYLLYEIIVCDGGSSDESLNVLKKYDDHIAYWYSYKDEGQADAINRGFNKCSGSILMWLNSDDILMPGALTVLANNYMPGLMLYAGLVKEFNEDGTVRVVNQSALKRGNFLGGRKRKGEWHMPGIAFNRELWLKIKPLSVRYRYVFDAKAIDNALRICSVVIINEIIAAFRLHAKSKTMSERKGFYIEGWILYLERYKTLSKTEIILQFLYYYPRFAYAKFANVVSNMYKKS